MCSSWGNCLTLDTLRDLGVAVGTERGAPDGKGLVVSGIVVDGIEEVRFIRPWGDVAETVVPVRDNVFRVDLSRPRPLPSEVRWRDWRGERRFELPIVAGAPYPPPPGVRGGF